MKPGDVLESRFRLEEEAGAGAMGVVWRAHDGFTGEPCAVKVVKADRRLSARFAREARVLSQLRHPAVARYVAHGTTPEGVQFLAMEWLDGEDLERRLDRGPLGVGEALELARRVADALALAHGRGIIHRDLKPNNLFLPKGDPREVKLLDFGIARVQNATAGMTAAGAVIGTPGYMAPEQARGDTVIDARADVFSLGCVLFECLTGRPAFVGDNPLALLAKIVLEEPSRLAELRPEVPRAVDALVARMLAKAPADRPASGAAARDAIAAAAAAEPIAAAAPPRALTRGEQHVVSVVIASTSARVTPKRVTEVLSSSGNDEVDSDAPTMLEETFPRVEPPELARIAKLGARVERLADGVVVAALHGAGVATDQAAQAARCALVLRGGYEKAPIVVATGRGLFLGRLPVGPVIERAAEMLRALPPDAPPAIHVDDVTAGLLPSRFRLREAKPFAELVEERRGADLPRTLLGRATPFVGRDADLTMLLGVCAQAAGDGVRRAVVVTGAPGLGKSRLREELVARLRAQAEAPAIWIGAAEPLGSGAPLALLGRALRGVVGESGSELRERVSARVAEEEAPRVATFLGELVGVDAHDPRAAVLLHAARREPPLMAEQMLRAFVDFTAAETELRPVVLVLEDAHWADLPTMKFVDAALRELEDRPLVCIAFARPEIEDAFPALWGERGVLRMTLAALAARPAERLAREVLGKDADSDVVTRVVQQAGGNPFFLEELLRSVAAGAEGSLPETVLAIVQKRLEGLDDEARRVLRAASVFGLDFSRAAATALVGADVGPTLDGLVDRELLVVRPAPEEYAFRHALVREAAYHMLTDADRALAHRLAGAWLEQHGDPDAALLAEHYERGGDRDSAVRAYALAAKQALATDDLAGCLRLAAAGLALGAQGAARGALHVARAEALHWRAEFAAAYDEAAAALELLDGEAWFDAVAVAIASAATAGRTNDAHALAERLAARGGPRGPSFRMAVAQSATYLLGAGDPADALLALLPEDGDEPLLLARIHLARAMRAQLDGDPLRLFEHVRDAAAEFERAGHARGARAARGNAGFASTELGRHEEAEALLASARDAARRAGEQGTVAWATLHLAIVVARLGRADEALGLARGAAESAHAQGNVQLQAEATIVEAEIVLDGGDALRATDCAEHARVLAEGASPLRARALATLADARRTLGDVHGALAAAEDAMKIVVSASGVGEAEPAVRAAYAEALDAAGRRAEARDAIARARESVVRRASRIGDPEARRVFLDRVTANARILRLATSWSSDSA